MTKGEFNYWLTIKPTGVILLSTITTNEDSLYQESHLTFDRAKVVFASFDVGWTSPMRVQILFDYERWFHVELANPMASYPEEEREEAMMRYSKNYEAMNAFHNDLTGLLMSILADEHTFKGTYEVYPA